MNTSQVPKERIEASAKRVADQTMGLIPEFETFSRESMHKAIELAYAKGAAAGLRISAEVIESL